MRMLDARRKLEHHRILLESQPVRTGSAEHPIESVTRAGERVEYQCPGRERSGLGNGGDVSTICRPAIAGNSTAVRPKIRILCRTNPRAQAVNAKRNRITQLSDPVSLQPSVRSNTAFRFAPPAVAGGRMLGPYSVVSWLALHVRGGYLHPFVARLQVIAACPWTTRSGRVPRVVVA